MHSRNDDQLGRLDVPAIIDASRHLTLAGGRLGSYHPRRLTDALTHLQLARRRIDEAEQQLFRELRALNATEVVHG